MLQKVNVQGTNTFYHKRICLFTPIGYTSCFCPAWIGAACFSKFVKFGFSTLLAYLFVGVADFIGLTRNLKCGNVSATLFYETLPVSSRFSPAMPMQTVVFVLARMPRSSDERFLLPVRVLINHFDHRTLLPLRVL